MVSSFYPPWHIGGDATHVENLSEELHRRGHEVHVFCSKDAYYLKCSRSFPENNENTSIEKHVVNTFLHATPITAYLFGFSPTVMKKLNGVMRSVSPDVVHYHNTTLLGGGVVGKKREDICLYTAHDYWLICQKSSLYRCGVCNSRRYGDCIMCMIRSFRMPQLWRGKTYKPAVDKIIAPSKFMKQRIDAELDVSCIHIPNFCPKFSIGDNPEETGYFLYVGPLEEGRGIKKLLHAWGKINRKLKVVGRGSLEGYLRGRCGSNIELLGAVKKRQLIKLYLGAEAVIMPALHPLNCPMVALEAISVGTPMICTRCGGLPEIAEKIDGRLIFDDDDDLRRIVENFDKQKYAKKTREVYEEYYSPTTFMKNYMGVIKGDL